MASLATRPAETDLYPAVKAFLEAQGYTVKSEIRGCDVVALRGDAPPVIVELKLAFSLALLLQGIDRLSLTDRVYLAVSRPRGRRARGVSVYRREIRDLCRRVGLGLLTVAPGRRTKELTRLLGEHARRAGDPNRGGVTRTPIVTAYRQEALRCALLIRQGGRANIKMLRETGVVPNVSSILQRDVYGWFRRRERATYELTDRAQQDIDRFAAAGTLPELGAGAR